ncbi:MAG: dihydrolipoamide acetyltransferase family protein [bacterium]|nr:dihydrolipoamide acetyltransferase family protein [bacterium]
MAEVFNLPAVGDSMVEAEIVEWFVDVGDEVALDQVICSIETDKSVVEMTSPYRGTVMGLGGQPGDVISVGAPLIVVAVRGSTGPVPSDRKLAMPKVRKAARESGADLADVTGSGPQGAVTLADLNSATAPAGDRRERLSSTRRSIAHHLAESAKTVPQFTAMIDCDASALLHTRAALVERHDAPTPMDALLIALLLPVLREHPVMNAYLDGDEIVYSSQFDIGVAVDTGDGLMVPVVRHADALGIADLSAQVKRLADSARSRSLAPDEFNGQTCTVNNVGAVGIMAGTPILPLKTSAIVAFGRIRPVVALRAGQPVEVSTMTISATFDHRIIDGGHSGRFLAQLKQHLEVPALGLL